MRISRLTIGGGIAALAICAACACFSCSPVAVKVYNFENKLLNEADSLFHIGSYEYARVKYTKIRDEYPQTPSGVTAQYQLGYLSLYYANPFSDYNVALREFKRFASQYPSDKRMDMVNNWIRILTVMQDFSKDYYGNTNKLQQLTDKNSTIFRSYGTLQEAFLKCDAKVDSLQKRIMVLEGIIEEIDKIR